MRGLFFLWRLCGCASLKLPALGRQPAMKHSYGNRCPSWLCLPSEGGPSLAPSRNVGVTFLTSLLPLTDLIYRGAVRLSRRFGRTSRMATSACGPVIQRGLSLPELAPA